MIFTKPKQSFVYETLEFGNNSNNPVFAVHYRFHFDFFTIYFPYASCLHFKLPFYLDDVQYRKILHVAKAF